MHLLARLQSDSDPLGACVHPAHPQTLRTVTGKGGEGKGRTEEGEGEGTGKRMKVYEVMYVINSTNCAVDESQTMRNFLTTVST